MNKTKLIIASASLFLAAAFTANAQTTTIPTYESDYFGARAGDWEFTLGGSGGSNKDFDNSLGGVNFSLGYFLSDTFEVSLRQSINYSNGPGSGADYNGSTFIAIDQHFGTGKFVPFIGINAGRLYGDNTNETWAAGIEGGLKLYVKPKTFIFALVNYAWTFDDSDDATDNFNDGAVLWTVGIGFNF